MWGDLHVGMHVVELSTGVAVLNSQPPFAVFRDDPEFPVVRNIEPLSPPRIDAGVLKIPLRKQVHLGRCPDAEEDQQAGR